jgi:hypothetical protein
MPDHIWLPRYSGPGKSGVCVCGHDASDHHGGIVMNQDYYAQTGEGRVPGGCEFYNCNEGEGLDGEGRPHCFDYQDRGLHWTRRLYRAVKALLFRVRA